MKQITRRATLKIALFCTLLVILAPGIWPQDQNGTTTSKYNVTELPTLGGTVGAAFSVDNKGWVAGVANLPGDRQEHAVLWVNDTVADLSTLGGPNSAIGFPVKHSQGVLVGFSQTVDSDPLHEDWKYVCGAFNLSGVCEGKNLISRGFVWQNGSIAYSLPPFSGGNISEAFGVNNSRQVVGVAESGNQDQTCVHPQKLDYYGVIWNPEGSMQMLSPYPGDHISAAVAINNNGQVVGASGPCAPISPSIGAHALLWQNGSVIDLGNLGGTTNNVAFSINGESQVVGLSGLLGNTTAHAFIWQNGVMSNLGTLSGDVFSIAYSINDNGQVVGQSCDANNKCRAFLWQYGTGMVDLNSLAAPGSPQLVVAYDINNQGQIVGEAYDPTTENSPAYLATPN
jgi:probable HAF family extracellular repeat protein